MGLLWKISGGGKKKHALLDEVQESGGKLIVNGYRRVATQCQCAPTSKTSDDEIIEIYKKVGAFFKKAFDERGKHIPAGVMNII